MNAIATLQPPADTAAGSGGTALRNRQRPKGGVAADQHLCESRDRKARFPPQCACRGTLLGHHDNTRAVHFRPRSGHSPSARRPDLAFVSAAKWPLDRLLPETGDWRIVPDLVVEVVSPNDVFQDVLSKDARILPRRRIAGLDCFAGGPRNLRLRLADQPARADRRGRAGRWRSFARTAPRGRLTLPAATAGHAPDAGRRVPGPAKVDRRPRDTSAGRFERAAIAMARRPPLTPISFAADGLTECRDARGRFPNQRGPAKCRLRLALIGGVPGDSEFPRQNV